MIEKSYGAVVYTSVGNEVFYVLVKQGRYYSLPKGHIEPGETPYETAEREIYEETCVKATILDGFVRSIEYRLPNGNFKQATYFIACFSHQEPHSNPNDPVDALMVSYEEALNLITFGNVKEILKQAHQWILSKKKSLDVHI